MHKFELRPMILAAASCHRAETIDTLLAEISRHGDNLTKNEGRGNGRVSTEPGEMRFLAIKNLYPIVLLNITYVVRRFDARDERSIHGCSAHYGGSWLLSRQGNFLGNPR